MNRLLTPEGLLRLLTPGGSLCQCGCGRYWEDCRRGVAGDGLAESLYCDYGYIDAFGRCGDCNLVNYGRDCKNNNLINH